MGATLVSRERRPIWVGLAIGLVAVTAAGTWLGLRARGSALDEGTLAATRAATVVTPILAADGVNGPLEGRRARNVRDDLEHALDNRAEAFGRVRVFTTDGDVLLEGRRTTASAEDVASAITRATNGDSAGILHDGAFLGYVMVTTPQGDRVVELTARTGRFVPDGPWGVVVPITAVLAVLCLGLALVASRTPAAEIVPRASRYRPAIPRRPLSTDVEEILPSVSVFSVGHEDLEVHHGDDVPARQGTRAEMNGTASRNARLITS